MALKKQVNFFFSFYMLIFIWIHKVRMHIYGFLLGLWELCGNARDKARCRELIRSAVTQWEDSLVYLLT